MVRNFASMPLKPVPQLPAGAGSTPGPLEESLLRCGLDSICPVRPELHAYVRNPIGLLCWWGFFVMLGMYNCLSAGVREKSGQLDSDRIAKSAYAYAPLMQAP